MACTNTIVAQKSEDVVKPDLSVPRLGWLNPQGGQAGQLDDCNCHLVGLSRGYGQSSWEGQNGGRCKEHRHRSPSRICRWIWFQFPLQTGLLQCLSQVRSCVFHLSIILPAIRYRWYLRQQLQILNRKDHESWSSYDESFYKANQCLGGCPTNAHCEWGICECKEGFQRAWGGCHNLVGWSPF